MITKTEAALCVRVRRGQQQAGTDLDLQIRSAETGVYVG